MAAPSPTPLAFPAVVLMGLHSGKAGFNFERDSRVTPGRNVSSTEMTVPRISMGKISSAKIPLAEAFKLSLSLVETYGCKAATLLSQLCYAR